MQSHELHELYEIEQEFKEAEQNDKFGDGDDKYFFREQFICQNFKDVLREVISLREWLEGLDGDD